MYRLTLIIALSLGVFTNIYAVSAQEREALIALYNSTNGSSWTDSSNWLGLPGSECTWSGVNCNSDQTHIVSIDIGINQLSGSLPAELGNCTHLTELSFIGNQISGNTQVPIILA